jgi:hypothetical protein
MPQLPSLARVSRRLLAGAFVLTMTTVALPRETERAAGVRPSVPQKTQVDDELQRLDRQLLGGEQRSLQNQGGQ